jgi:anti-anti-sigma regulatory factor
MLKITTRLEAESIALVVEGRVAGRWVKELQDCWTHIPEHRKRGALIDLTDVIFIDQFGQELLRRLWQEGAELKAAGCLNNCLVDQITASSRVDRPMLHRSKTNSRKEGMD